MGLTADEIEQHSFRERFRGYDPEEVDAFLDRVVASLRAVEHERDEAQRERDEARQAAEETQRGSDESEQLLRKTLVTAQRTAEQTIADAHGDAERIRHRGNERAERIVAAARQQARDVADAIEGLLGVHERLRESIRAVLAEHAELLDREGQLPPTAEVIAQLRRLADETAAPSDRGAEDHRGAEGLGGEIGHEGSADAHAGGDEAAEEHAADGPRPGMGGLEIEPPPQRGRADGENGKQR